MKSAAFLLITTVLLFVVGIIVYKMIGVETRLRDIENARPPSSSSAPSSFVNSAQDTISIPSFATDKNTETDEKIFEHFPASMMPVFGEEEDTTNDELVQEDDLALVTEMERSLVLDEDVEDVEDDEAIQDVDDEQRGDDGDDDGDDDEVGGEEAEVAEERDERDDEANDTNEEGGIVIHDDEEAPPPMVVVPMHNDSDNELIINVSPPPAPRKKKAKAQLFEDAQHDDVPSSPVKRVRNRKRGS